MSQQSKTTVPQVRFQGFPQDWDEMPMGELLWFKNGYNAGKEQYGTGRKFINVLDIIENDYITHDRIIGRVDILDDDFKKNEVTYGDILFQRSSETREEVGQANVYLDEHKSATFGGFVIRGKPSAEFDPVYFNAMLKSASVRREITSRSGGSTRYNIGQESLEDALVTVAPDLAEQQKIAAFWMSLDRMIGLHQRKHDKLVTLKQAMLQKMFPQDGATTPEIRFKGFEEDWERTTLGTIGNTYSGLSGKTKDDFGHGAGRYVTYMGVFSNTLSHEGMTEMVEIDASQNEVQFGDVFFTTSSETPEDVGMSSVWTSHTENVYLNSFCFGFRPTSQVDHRFLAYVLRAPEFRKSISFLAQGISRFNISKRKAMDIELRLPNTDEQEKIGNYFDSLDKLISKHSTQLEKLKNIKSACLEKMFV